jgi:chromosomal replication initiation ATPase DnaA
MIITVATACVSDGYNFNTNCQQTLGHLEEAQIKSSRSDCNKTKSQPSMPDVDQVCAAYFKVDKDGLLKAHVKGNEARKIAIYGSRVWAKEKNSIIADHYHCRSHSNVSNVVKEINEKIKVDTKFSDEIKRLRKRLLSENDI